MPNQIDLNGDWTNQGVKLSTSSPEMAYYDSDKKALISASTGQPIPKHGDRNDVLHEVPIKGTKDKITYLIRHQDPNVNNANLGNPQMDDWHYLPQGKTGPVSFNSPYNDLISRFLNPGQRYYDQWKNSIPGGKVPLLWGNNAYIKPQANLEPLRVNDIESYLKTLPNYPGNTGDFPSRNVYKIIPNPNVSVQNVPQVQQNVPIGSNATLAPGQVFPISQRSSGTVNGNLQ